MLRYIILLLLAFAKSALSNFAIMWSTKALGAQTAVALISFSILTIMKRILRFILFSLIGLCLVITILGVIASRIVPTVKPTVIVATAITQPDSIEELQTSKTPQVTEMQLAPTGVPQVPTATAVDVQIQQVNDNYESGGLGLNKTAFDKKYGPDEGKTTLFTVYQNKSMHVTFGKEGNVNYLQYSWSQGDFVSKEDAHAVSKLYMPPDARLLKTYNARGDVTRPVELYMSESLVARSDYWPGEESMPGYFIVTYTVQTAESSSTDKVSSIIIANGNNP